MSLLIAWILIVIGTAGAICCGAALVNRAAAWSECCECGRTWDWLGCPGIPPASAAVQSFTCPQCLRERAQAERDLIRAMNHQPPTK